MRESSKATGTPPGVDPEDRLCGATTRDGLPCARIVGASQEFCYAHSPEHAERRRAAASKAGKSKPGSRVKELDRLLAQLFDDVIAGKVERGVAAVATQIVYGRTRLVEVERKVAELEMFEERVAELESIVADRKRAAGRSGRW
jgi:hypothetical protein